MICSMKFSNQLFVYFLILSLSTHYACKKKESFSLKTTDVTDIQAYSATSGGTVIDDGGSPIINCGVCWSTNALPTVADNNTLSPFTSNNFTSYLTGLEPGTSYWVRAYATNNKGTWYGNQVYFATYPELPSITTDISSITPTSAVVSGHLKYGKGIFIQKAGVCFSKSENPTIDDNFIECILEEDSFSANLKKLVGGVLYYARPYVIVTLAANAHLFIIYGNQVSFSTFQILPTITTLPVSAIDITTATASGYVPGNGGEHLISRGICLDTTSVPSLTNCIPIEGDEGYFHVNLENLLPGTDYYYRAYATNSVGTVYGEIQHFTTHYGTVSDVSGNIYKTIRIGAQIWMKENLKTKKYNDDTDIQLITSDSEWGITPTPAFCFYNNNEFTIFGALYNWYAVNTGKLCPVGWHVPSYEDWNILSTYLGGDETAGLKLKEVGSLNWIDPVPADNSSNFTALPGGYRVRDEFVYACFYNGLLHEGWWWATNSVSADSTFANCRALRSYNSAFPEQGMNKHNGLSVRCVKDK